VTADYFLDPANGMIVQVPIPSSETLEAVYPSDYRVHRTSGIVHVLKRVQAHLLFGALKDDLPGPEQSILELGSGGGHFLVELKRRGFRHLTALDWSPNVREEFERHGIPFILSTIEAESERPGTYDCIIMINTIEHVRNPETVLRALKKKLNPDGRILLITPNARSLSHRIFGRHWAGLHAPRHVYVFSPDAMTQLAAMLGFKVRHRSLSDPSAWAFSVQNLVRSKVKRPKSFRGTAWYALLLLPVSLIPSAVEHALNRSSSMIVSLRREASEKLS